MASGEGFFGEIDADGFRAGEGGDEGEGAGIGEGIEEAFGGEFADERAIGALIDEEARGVAGGEIEEEADAIFFDHRAEWGVGGAMDEGGGEAIDILAGEEFGEDAGVGEVMESGPGGEFGLGVGEGVGGLVGDEEVIGEAFDPSVWEGGEAMGVGVGGGEGGEGGGGDPVGERIF